MRMVATLPLDGSNLSLDAVRRLMAARPPRLGLAATARRRVDRAAAFVEELARSGKKVYGITTGFGRLADVPIDKDHLAGLQERLIVSHAAGVGPRLTLEETRIAIAVRAATLAGGNSGVRATTLKTLI